jgi:hypothetical protein
MFDRTPLTNRRPITLITCPSNPHLEVASPGKGSALQGSNNSEDEENFEHAFPMKKVKKE